MNELQTSLTHYQVKKENGAITVLANKPICVCDHFWDCMNEEWVFAVKCDDGQSRYHIDYLFLDKNFELLNALTEDKGVNPQFLTAQDNTAWVSLSSTSTEREGEIVLPLQNRFRITKEIVRKDLGMDAIFCLNNQCCSYQIDLFNHKKYDKLFVYIKQENSIFLKIYGMDIRQLPEINVLLLAENGATLFVRYMFRKSTRTVIFFLIGKVKQLQI